MPRASPRGQIAQMNSKEVDMRTPWLAVAAWLLLPHVAAAQPSLDSLWPNADGSRWEYQFTFVDFVSPDQSFTGPAWLQLSGTVETSGGTAQVLLGGQDVPTEAGAAPALPPIVRALWRARPDLRARIVARYGADCVAATTSWEPLLLHDGYLMKSATSIQMWQPGWDHPTWTYLRDDLGVGATFTHQLVPELADDVFLYGTVEANDATVATQAATFEHALRMGYRIDFGWSTGISEGGTWLGRFRSETRGHVHYVPGVGPVELLEDFVPFVEVDCDTLSCPWDWTSQLNQIAESTTLSLRSEPTAIAPVSWSEVKALYRE
jgi:hypothetical protein